MKKFIAFFVSIFTFLFGRKLGLKKQPAPEKETLEEKMAKAKTVSRKSYRGPTHLPHNNRSMKRNKRGVRSRYVQYNGANGRTIFHEVTKTPAV